MLGCNYFWMLCEGIYLHTLIVVAVFAEEQHLHWYYLLGWGKCQTLCGLLILKPKYHYPIYKQGKQTPTNRE